MRREDFQPGDPPWQEHPDNTFERPTSWGPGPKWIYQVLLRCMAEPVAGGTITCGTVCESQCRRSVSASATVSGRQQDPAHATGMYNQC